MYAADKPDFKLRRSRDALLPARGKTWLFSRLAGITKAADRKFKVLRYRKSDGVVQPKYDELQYAEYGPGGHFGQWHLDAQDDTDDEGDSEYLRDMSVILIWTTVTVSIAAAVVVAPPNPTPTAVATTEVAA